MKKAAALLALALGLGSLTGCSPAGGTAAVVNGVAIPDSLVTEWSEACAQALASNPKFTQTAETLRPQMVKWAVLGEMSKQFVEANHQGPTDEQLSQYIANSGVADVLNTPSCSKAAYSVARHDLVALSLGAGAQKYLSSFHVELNPRYGVWDQSKLNIVNTGSLSVLVEKRN